MFKHFWLGVFRGLLRRKVHSLINLASLALGLAVFTFAFLYVKHELSYDRGWPDAGRIHRLLIEQQGLADRPDGLYTSSVGQVFPALRDDFPEYIEQLSRVYAIGVRRAGMEGELPASVAAVDPAFADIFQLEVTSGSLAIALGSPGFIAVEESYAARYPGGLTIGSRIELEGTTTYNGERGAASFEVAALYRLPGMVSEPVRFSLLTMMHEYTLQLFPAIARRSWETPTPVWLRLKPGMEATALEAQMPAFINRTVTYRAALGPEERISERLRYRFQPLTALHLHPINFEAVTAGDANRVLTVAAIGMLVLLAGCSNSISLNLASVLERRREIGIRKAAGAQNSDLLRDHLGETMLVAMCALVPALLLVKLLSSPFAALLNFRETLQVTAGDYLALLLIAGVVGLLNGAYPALVLSTVRPQAVLKVNAATGMGGAQSLRTLIVGFQFSVALVLMLATLALYVQLAFVRAQPLGFSVDNLLFVSSPDPDRGRQSAFFEELRKLPGVQLASIATSFPSTGSVVQGGSVLTLASKREVITELRAMLRNAGTDYFDILRIPLLAGRVFDPARDAYDSATRHFADQSEGSSPAELRVILNRSAVRALGFATPEAAADQLIWRKLSSTNGESRDDPLRIVGVVEDNMYNSVRYLPGPEVYFPILIPFGNWLVRYQDGAEEAIQREIQEAWQRVGGTSQPYFNFLEPYLDSAYQVEQSESRLLLYSAGLALFLSAIGLYGLAAFTMERRVKEVGIRKVLGAEQGRITTLFLWRYARPVLLASVVAIPVAVYFVLQWMQRFPYQMEKIWLLPLSLGGAALVLVIALLTVTGVVLKAARSRPVQALRYE